MTWAAIGRLFARKAPLQAQGVQARSSGPDRQGNARSLATGSLAAASFTPDAVVPLANPPVVERPSQVKSIEVDLRFQTLAAARQNAQLGSELQRTRDELAKTRAELTDGELVRLKGELQRACGRIAELQMLLSDFRIACYCEAAAAICVDKACRVTGCLAARGFTPKGPTDASTDASRPARGDQTVQGDDARVEPTGDRPARGQDC